MDDLTSAEVKDLADRLVDAASEHLAFKHLNYWGPTLAQTRAAITAVLKALQRDARSHGVGLDFGPLMVELGKAVSNGDRPVIDRGEAPWMT